MFSRCAFGCDEKKACEGHLDSVSLKFVCMSTYILHNAIL